MSIPGSGLSAPSRRRTKIGLVVLGQSNENGQAELMSSASVSQISAYPGAFRSLINTDITSGFDGVLQLAPNYNGSPLYNKGSPWPTVYDALWNAGYEPLICNMSIGSLSYVNHVVTSVSNRIDATAYWQRRPSLGPQDEGDFGSLVNAQSLLWYCSKGNYRLAALDNKGSPLVTPQGNTIPNRLDYIWTESGRATGTGTTLAKAIVTGSISGSVLTVTAVTSGALAVGQILADGANIGSTIKISSFGTGSGGVGTYNLSGSMTLASTTIRAAAAGDVSVDGSIEWTCVGNTLALGYTLGQLLTLSAIDVGWDPLGIAQRALRKVQALRSAGCQRVVAVICNGQSDVTQTAANYQLALTQLAQMFRAVGAEVGIGLSTFTRGGNVTNWNTLQTGRANALTALASDAKVFAAANLYQSMGTVEGSNGLTFNTGGYGSVNDGVHINAPAQIVAGGYHAAALLSYIGSGWV